ncbi:MAG TPA: tetratricopeptide repeat protein [Bryobacteraceae bacterium]|nr:tetratricopeptide repeat protein [Bryobacteraceae bacterium]
MRVWFGAQIPVLVCALCVCAHPQDPAGGDLPELPKIDTADFLPVIRAQIERAERNARTHSRDANAAGALGMTLHAYERYEVAARAYAHAQRLDPEAFDWVYLSAVLLTQQGDFDGAVKSFRKALELRPGDLAAELRLGQSLSSTGNWDEAGTLYRKIVEAHPDCPQAWYGLGRVQAAKGEHEAAAQSYSKACDVFPPYGAAHFALAGELRKLGKSTEAEEHAAAYLKDPSAEPPLHDASLQRVRELNQGVHTHLQRGGAFEKEGKLEDAIREHEAALAIDPDNVQVHINLISLYGRTGDEARAKVHFEAATRLSPGRPDAWYNYGVLMSKRKEYREAEGAFRRAVEINPYYAEAHNNLGALYELQGRLNDAAREFRDAIANKPDYPLARFHLARILVNEEKYDEAIQQLLRALTPEDDQTPVYLYALAAVYARAGDREHALNYYGRARDAAHARGQVQLLGSIERDLKMFGGKR